MLELQTESDEDLQKLMQTPGAFAWWYVDLVDAQGRGLVLIWSFGLPFLPGSRNCPPAGARPSLSLALYEGFRPHFYTLQQFHPSEVEVTSPQSMRFGDSQLDLIREGGRVRLRAALSMAVLGSGRIEGTVEAEGVACRTPDGDDGSPSVHRWAPILVGQRGRARLSFDSGEDFKLDGRIYVDSNGSDRPLHALGIADWRWGRIALGDRELVYYFVQPEPGSDMAPIHHTLEARADGTLRTLTAEATFSGPRRSVYGLTHHERMRLAGPKIDLDIRFRELVDDGPFYLRFLVEAHERLTDQRGVGVAESVAPGRVDLPWQRPFIRMRTQMTHGGNSIWLPLFSGSRQGRLGRLARHWTSGAGGTGAPADGERP